MDFDFDAEARQDADQAAVHYEQREDGLGLEFLMELDRTIRRIQFDPESWQLIGSNVRRARLRRFPYDVYFRVYSDSFLIIAVAHHHQRPRRWRADR